MLYVISKEEQAECEKYPAKWFFPHQLFTGLMFEALSTEEKEVLTQLRKEEAIWITSPSANAQAIIIQEYNRLADVERDKLNKMHDEAMKELIKRFERLIGLKK